MGVRDWIFITVLLSCIGVSVAPLAASCPGGIQTDEKSLAVHFARSDAVFTGRAVSQRIVTPATAGSKFTETTFEVEELWKGRPAAKTLTVLSCGYFDVRTQQHTLCGGGSDRFLIGSPYVLFVRGNPLEVDCEPVEPITSASHVLAWLSSLPRQAR
jgi:hypothetical protein